jgi:hypothetical protein
VLFLSIIPQSKLFLLLSMCIIVVNANCGSIPKNLRQLLKFFLKIFRWVTIKVLQLFLKTLAVQ